MTTYCVKGSRILYKTDRNCQHKHKKPTSKTMASSTKSKRSSQRDKKTGCPTSLTLRVHNQNVSSFSLHGSHPSEVALTQIIIIPLHQRMLSVLGPLLQKLGNNFIHFEQDYSPSSSVDHHSLNLAIKYEGGELQYQTAIADRSINPLPINIYEV